jgi:hypothetical protein
MSPTYYALDVCEIIPWPEGSYWYDPQARARHVPIILITPALFWSLSDYTQSLPTGPRAGRVYRKNLSWQHDAPDNWFVYFVEDAPDGDGQLHHPYMACVIDEKAIPPAPEPAPQLLRRERHLTGIELLRRERRHQVDDRGFTLEHDITEHTHGDLAQAALVYIRAALGIIPAKAAFPFADDSLTCKPRGIADPVHDLVKAGSLIAAEIDRFRAVKDE